MLNYSISITLPAFNEQETVEQVSKKALSVLERLTSDYELLLVNDGSLDKTAEIIDSLAKKEKHIRVIHHKDNKGFSGAIKSCYRNATKGLVFLAAADGQIDFKELSQFVRKIEEGYDVAVGYRIQNPESFYRKVNSRFFHFLCRLFFGLKFKEISTAVLWKKKVLDSIDIESDDSSAMIEPELIYKALKKGYRIGEVPFHFYPRLGGRPKGTNLKMIVKTVKEMLRLSWKLRRYNSS